VVYFFLFSVLLSKGTMIFRFASDQFIGNCIRDQNDSKYRDLASLIYFLIALLASPPVTEQSTFSRLDLG